MATTNYSLHSLNYRHRTLPLGRRHSLLDSPPASLSISPKSSNGNNKISSVKASSVSSATQSISSSFDLLSRHLSEKDFLEADNETRRLLIALAGEPAQKRGYVFFSEVQFIQETDLNTIDQLWRDNSNNKFGYSVQKRLWEKADKDFTKFFIKVGWMKKLDTEVLQYNYRAFPDEFMWELSDETPEGHLPLTNALRGTQLLTCILTHPAFQNTDLEEQQPAAANPQLPKGLLKTNYSF